MLLKLAESLEILVQLENSPICFTSDFLPQVRNPYGFFLLFAATEEYPTMLATLQGFLMWHRSSLRLDAFPNTTPGFFWESNPELHVKPNALIH